MSLPALSAAPGAGAPVGLGIARRHDLALTASVHELPSSIPGLHRPALLITPLPGNTTLPLSEKGTP